MKSKTLTIPHTSLEQQKCHSLLLVQPFWKTIWQHFWGRVGFLGFSKLNIVLPSDIPIKSLSNCPVDLKTYINVKTCVRIFITGILVLKTGSYRSFIGEWIKNYGTALRGNVIQQGKKWPVKPWKESQMYIAKRKKPVPKGYTHRMLPGGGQGREGGMNR